MIWISYVCDSFENNAEKTHLSIDHEIIVAILHFVRSLQYHYHLTDR